MPTAQWDEDPDSQLGPVIRSLDTPDCCRAPPITTPCNCFACSAASATRNSLPLVVENIAGVQTSWLSDCPCSVHPCPSKCSVTCNYNMTCLAHTPARVKRVEVDEGEGCFKSLSKNSFTRQLSCSVNSMHASQFAPNGIGYLDAKTVPYVAEDSILLGRDTDIN